ncbi:MAG: heparinase II/III family protein [Candidatus Jettenia sp.]|nr:MAG: heparinase II/III family protein [Candidatus Jettenia sp.]
MSKINWYINRLTLMSPLEIGYRIKEEIKKIAEKKYFNAIRIDIPEVTLNIHRYTNLKDREKIISFIKENNLLDQNKGKILLEHKFSFFSFDKEFFGKEINWHYDYKNKKESSIIFYKDIDFKDFNRIGNIKYIWEVNRHQHLITLAKIYYLTGDVLYKEEVCSQISSWIESNPYLKGVNWTSSLELAIRLISWSWIWNFLGEIETGLRERWIDCIFKHCKFIDKNLSQYSSANNHLIGEASGLFIASIIWPFERESKIWRDKSYKILVDEIGKQNYDDGVNKEQAISYQQFVLDFFLLAGLLSKKNDIIFPQKYWDHIERMMEYIASMMDVHGNMPNIGDADDGYAIILSDEKNFNSYQSLLATGAVIFNRGDFKRRAGRFDEKSFWLLGIDGYEQFRSIEVKSFTPVKSFYKGGYFILSIYDDTEDEVKAIFDCGPLGYLSIAAHGHSDALSFTLSIGGKKFLVDPGTYSYHTHQEWRDYFKGTSAHNTIRIDGEDQSVSGGNFMWLRKAQVKVIKWESTEGYDFIKSEHNGYSRLKDPVIHWRGIFFNKRKGIFKIIDKINARKSHVIEQFFHFSKDCLVSKIQEREWEIKNDDKGMILKTDNKFNTEIISGSLKPILGWQSERFDVKEEIRTMVNRIEWKGSCVFETLIAIKNTGKANVKKFGFSDMQRVVKNPEDRVWSSVNTSRKN